MPAPSALFTFTHLWLTSAPPARVFEVLADADHYPQWWPQIRSVTRLGPDDGLARVRSLLPLTLTLHLRRTETDAAAGRLAVAITHDLTGWARWTVGPDADTGGTRAAYVQEVVVSAPTLARLAPHAGPLLRANHAWMMRSGERGLRRRLKE